MNFTPSLLNIKNLTSKIKINKIYCKNFLFTILVFDMFNNEINTKFNFMKFSTHVIKRRKHIGSILRAPYRYKSAQFSIGLYRYYLVLSFQIKSKCKPIIKNYTELNNFIIMLIKSYNYFESALVTQISRSILVPVYISII